MNLILLGVNYEDTYRGKKMLKMKLVDLDSGKVTLVPRQTIECALRIGNKILGIRYYDRLSLGNFYTQKDFDKLDEKGNSLINDKEARSKKRIPYEIEYNQDKIIVKSVDFDGIKQEEIFNSLEEIYDTRNYAGIFHSDAGNYNINKHIKIVNFKENYVPVESV